MTKQLHSNKPHAKTQKHGTRKTNLIIENSNLCLNDYYHSGNFTTPYQVLRTRAISLQKRGLLSSESIFHAATLDNNQWTSLYGGGRRRKFTYTGTAYPELAGASFTSISQFLYKIGRLSDRSIIWSRLKQSWKLDDALTIPYSKDRSCCGAIYAAIRLKTCEIYVGLTTTSVRQRWSFHINNAKNGIGKLAKAIQEDGSEGFKVITLESGIKDTESLSSREIYWANKLRAHGPLGLNSAKAGGLGTPRGIPKSYNGRDFSSQSEAERILSKETSLPTYVIRNRIKENKPIPLHVRKHSKHRLAGSNIFRRWLALIKRHPDMIFLQWECSFDSFLHDVSPVPPKKQLTRIDPTQPWGPNNFSWLTKKEAIELTHGKSIIVFGKLYRSHTALANAFKISVSTLKNRVFKQRMSYEEAVTRKIRGS